MSTLYNETDRYCCDWLSNLMDAGLITAGKIDDRRIEELEPNDVLGYERVHFFAGIAGWDLALRLAGWPTTKPVWTGSCPCQPFSAAGQGKAADDERHLWPDWFRLIRAVRPAIVFGEQVEAAIGWGWIDLVHADMAAKGYATRFAVLPACSVGAPHIRNRLWFVADADGGNASTERLQRSGQQRQQLQDGGAGELADAERAGWSEGRALARNGSVASGGLHGELGYTNESRPQGRGLDAGEHAGQCVAGPTGAWRDIMGNADSPRCQTCDSQSVGAGARSEQPAQPSPWAGLEWIACSDGKARPAKPGIFPLAHGIPGRVGQLRAAGNAIVPALAAEFIKATMTCG